MTAAAAASRYAADADERELEAYFGLPREVRFCRTCTLSNQRPCSAVEYGHHIGTRKQTIAFDENGVCDACRAIAMKRGPIDWKERERRLVEVCDRHRRDDGRYDCIVPGSGGKDSFYAAHMLKYKYGMHPLTVTWAPHVYTEWGWHNLQNWIHAGFDNVLVTPNGKAHRLLTRLAIENLFHPFQPFMIGQKALAPKLSALYGVPLVFYGDNEAEDGNPIADNLTALKNWKYFTAEDQSTVYLSGVSLAELKERYGFVQNDLEPYMPADPEAMRKVGTEVHYLGYYLQWHPQTCYYYAVEHSNFRAAPERTAGTYSKYSSIDDKIDDLHYYTTFIKFGIGRATYDASQEIRHGDITREEGIALVRRYDGEFPERFFDDLLRYMSIPEHEFPIASRMLEQPIMDRDTFTALADKFRSPHLWKFENGAWALRRAIWQGS
jgi:N-acetyl sugar amidotransferase